MKSSLLSLSLLITTVLCAQTETPLDQLIASNFKTAAAQYKLLEKNTPSDKMPKTFKDGKSEASGTGWWTSGFFPGSLWLIYEATGDNEIKAIAEKRLKLEEKEQRFTGNHDIGFMIFCSFGNAYRITGNPTYKKVIDTAAFWQIKRYKPSIHAIQSWNQSNKFRCPVIIDNMMNLEQLCWVSQNGGDPKYKDIAITHANTTLKNHFRKDHSSYHVVDYDIETGNVLKKVTHQGYADESAWSRGQAWGLYGYTMMYRFTKNKKYLKQAQAIAKFMIEHPNMPSDMIPVWDYNTPEGVNALRDASAGAIMASALMELAQYTKKKQAKKYRAVAATAIQTLSTPQYLAQPGENGGFALKHSVGSLPGNSEVDVPLTYADYYFFEAMQRYKSYLNESK
ncbi:glycoside hydrolase family 88 protein [Niabella insulamsoli]|uniref:glycoside hydrolase family 88 protein n=1 Tax=Niabella insulamsoli TaxID=3144874 RepID=UPI0031FCA42A